MKKYLHSLQKPWVGYLCLGISCLMWILIGVFGFMGLSATATGMTVTVCVVLGEVFFVLSVLVLGKEVFERIKQYFKSLWHKIKSVLRI